MFENMNISWLGLQILLFLARQPDSQFYGREIARTINKSVGGTHQNLAVLEHMQFIISHQSGKNKYYQINKQHPAIPHFKIFMTLYELMPVVDPLKSVSQKIVLFGSCARGEDTDKSDIDLFILTNQKKTINRLCQKIFFNRTIQPVIRSTDDFIQLKEKDPGFFHTIENGIVIWDDTDENI